MDYLYFDTHCITVSRRVGAKFSFRDLNIEENYVFFNNKKVHACFTLKGHFLT